MVQKQDVRFASGRDEVAGWWYSSGRPGAACVVMAHGFSLTMRDGLAQYTEAFAAAGHDVLVFDHRFLGESGGEPRQRFSIKDQQEDWRHAVAFARERSGVDRVHLWGYSFSGGHVATLAAEGTLPVASVMLLCPFLDGRARVLATPPRSSLAIGPRAVRDAVGLTCRIPVTGPDGSVAAMSLAGEGEGFARAVGEGSLWRNEITPSVFLSVGFFRPFRRAHRVTVPAWVGRFDRDVSVSSAAIDRFSATAPLAELTTYPGDHFDPFGPGGDPVVADQLAFLARVT